MWVICVNSDKGKFYFTDIKYKSIFSKKIKQSYFFHSKKEIKKYINSFNFDCKHFLSIEKINPQLKINFNPVTLEA